MTTIVVITTKKDSVLNISCFEDFSASLYACSVRVPELQTSCPVRFSAIGHGALRTRTLVWFGHGCSGDRMQLAM